MKKISTYCFYILVLSMLSSCHEQKVDKIILADASQPVFALIYIAEQNGYFKDENIEVEYLRFTSGRDALQSVIDGKADLATTYETPVVIQSIKGEDLGILTTLHKSSRNTALSARSDSNISEIKDLKGKKICVPFRTNGEFFLSQLLLHNEILLSEVTLIDARPSECVGKITRGEVDATAIWNPHAYKIKSLMKDNLVTFYSDVYTEVSMLVGIKEFISKNPAKIEKILRALVRANKYYKNNNKKSLDIVISSLPSVSRDIIIGTWDSFLPLIILDNVLVSILSNEAKWFFEKKLYTESIPDFNKTLSPKHLYNIDSSVVTVDVDNE